jgi:hypothetical protein
VGPSDITTICTPLAEGSFCGVEGICEGAGVKRFEKYPNAVFKLIFASDETKFVSGEDGATYAEGAGVYTAPPLNVGVTAE